MPDPDRWWFRFRPEQGRWFRIGSCSYNCRSRL